MNDTFSSVPSKYTITIGLAAGAIFGMAGSMVKDQIIQSLCWEISSVGLILGTLLYSKIPEVKEHTLVSTGFLMLAIAEAIMSVGTAAGITSSQPSFGAGIALYVPSLCLISYPALFVKWIRATGFLTAAVFLVAAMKIYSAEFISPVSA